MTDETLEALRRLLYVPDLEGIRVMRLQPGDVIVVETSGRLSKQQAEMAQHQLKAVWPEHEVLICDEGMRLNVAREGGFDEDDAEEEGDIEV